MKWRASAAAAALSAATLVVRPSSASPQARLVYARAEGTDGCPAEAVLRRAVAARIGYDPFFPWAPRTVVVLVSSRGEQLVARVQLVDDEAHAEGARELISKGHDCVALLDSIALTISIAIEPHLLPLPTAPRPPSTPAPTAQSPPIEAAPPQPSAASDSDSGAEADTIASSSSPGERRARLALELRGALGTEPAPAGGLAISAALDWHRFSLGTELTADLPTSAEGPAGGAVVAWLATASLAPCVHFGPAQGCGLASVGVLDGYSSGAPQPQSHTTLYAGVGARAGLELPLTGRVAGFVHADVLGNLARATLRIAADDVWKAPVASLALGLGVAAYF